MLHNLNIMNNTKCYTQPKKANNNFIKVAVLMCHRKSLRYLCIKKRKKKKNTKFARRL